MHLPFTSSASPFAVACPLDILVADDVDDVRQIVGLVLETARHRVSYAGSGREAVRCLHTAHFDVVVTDILMPDGDGLEVISAARRSSSKPRILAMSGGGKYMSGDDCLRVARGLGADDVLMKPFGSEQLLEAITRLTGGSHAASV